MIWNISPECLFSEGCLVFITTGIFCALVRWNHMCRPFCDDADYFYPARKLVTLFFAAITFLFPYVLSPMDPAVWLYTRAFGVLYYPVCFAVLIRQYFQLKKRQPKDPPQWKVYITSPFVLLLALLVPLLTGHYGWMIQHERAVLGIIGVISLILCGVTISVLLNLKAETDRYNTENYSNDEDFPYKFAIKILYTPILWIIFMWIVFVTGNRWIKFASDIMTSFWMIHILCIILHPQRVLRPVAVDERMRGLEEEKKQDLQEIEEVEEEEVSEDDGTPMDVIREEVLAVILRRFREPHLLKTEVLMELGNGKMNRASKFISSIGYYNLVNMFRLEYARLYKEAHPDAKQEEIALASGFVSRTAFYKAKRNVTEIDERLTQGIKI